MGKFTEKQRMIDKKVRSFPYFKFTAMLPMAEGCMLSCLIDRSDYQKDPMYLEVNYKNYLQKYLPGWSASTIETQIQKLINDGYVHYHKRLSNSILLQINWEKVHELEADYELYLKQFEINEEDSEKQSVYCEKQSVYCEKQSVYCEKQNSTLKNNMNNMNNYKNNIEDIILLTNALLEKNYNLNNITVRRLIEDRLKEGYTQADFEKVIINKKTQWESDSKMCQYLKPETLFKKDNFDRYLNETITPKKKEENLFLEL